MSLPPPLFFLFFFILQFLFLNDQREVCSFEDEHCWQEVASTFTQFTIQNGAASIYVVSHVMYQLELYTTGAVLNKTMYRVNMRATSIK